VPEQLSDEQVLFLADILPTSFEVGVLNGMVSPGDVVAIVGAGPIGLAAILTARLYTPGRIIAIDLADSRLESALRFGADNTINNGHQDPLAEVLELTDGLGADVAFEAVGVQQTFELATELIRPCGRVVQHRPAWQTRDVAPGEAVDPRCHPHDRPGRQVQHPAADAADRQRSPGPVAVRHPHVPARRHDGCLRHVRRRSQHSRAEGRAPGSRQPRRPDAAASALVAH
jgi:hypothetical protein